MCVQVATPPPGERTTTDDFNMCHVNIFPWGSGVLVSVLLGLCWDRHLETVMSLLCGTANE